MITATLQDWLAVAENHYNHARRCSDVAFDNMGRDGDPVTFDAYLRAATWHVQAGGLAVALGRAVSNGAHR